MRRIWRMGLLSLLGLGLAGCAWLLTPPQAVLTADFTSGVAPLTVQFDLSGSTGQIASYSLSFGDGSAPATGTDITVGVVHTYTTAGTRTATLTVQDARLRTSSASVVITVAVAPTATVSLGAFPASGSAPLWVDFWANITAAPGTRIKHIALDFDTDGTPDYEADVDFETYNWWIGGHTYNDPGTYTATLTVTDDAAQSYSATATISVTSPPPEITAFTATPDTGPEPLVVDFDFAAQAAAGREIVKYTLLCPGSDVPSVTEEGLTGNTLTRNDVMRTYATAGTYTATLKVWDDVGNTDEESLTIEVTP